MKRLVLRVVDRTIGSFLRVLQNTMIVREKPRRTVLETLDLFYLEESSQYIRSNIDSALIFGEKKKLWEYVCGILRDSNSEAPFILEFGVYKAESINFFASQSKTAEIYGFDSFEGLLEDWRGHTMPKGSFDLRGILPVVLPNVTLVKGWFSDTLPIFLHEHSGRKISLLHMDADTYESTSFVLNSLTDFVQPGTIIIFDEFYGYPNWKQHEYRAWNEFARENGHNYKHIAFSEMQVAIQII
jgi:hypothetical protein